MVTFSCLIDSRGMVEGVIGDLSEKMVSYFKSEELSKDDSSQGITSGRKASEKGREGAPSTGEK